jgi:quercetin dioxygenase-like cupin family protein
LGITGKHLKLTKMENSKITTGIILKAESIEWVPFTIPGWSGKTTAAFPNMDVEKAPFIAMAKLEPGAILQKHYHNIAIEAVYVVEGELINNGELLNAGSFLVHGPGVVHGPHTTETGCTLMFIQYPGVTVEDSVLVD